MKRISFKGLLILLILLSGCIKEDLSNCPASELLLRFRYTLNNQYTNLFGSQVSRVTVYIFDENGKYVDQFSASGNELSNDYVMHIPLPKGTYSAVVLGGDFTTYSVGELDAQNTLNRTLRKGATDINDFRVELNNISGAENYLYPAATPDDLYAGVALHAVSTTDNQTVTDVELIKDTKKIKVKISGIDIVGAPLEVYITALNGRSRFTNDLDLNHGTFKYTPVSTSVSVKAVQPNYMEADLKIMRLVLGQSPMLVVKNSTTGEMIYNENMISQILLTQKYVSQEDFDREDEFIFEIPIRSNGHNLTVSVSINGWVIGDVSPDM